MQVATARNVHTALRNVSGVIQLEGYRRDSRNGPVTLFDGPFTTHYTNPKERVIFWPERDANPFFHLMESIWMLAGRNDVEWLSQFAKKISDFSDDGVTFHGAYGYRWRQHFNVEQVHLICDTLRKNPDDRRCILQMWDVRSDLGFQGKDFPCNLMASFAINKMGCLNMTVFNRSNDMVWGAYGANAVHFSVLQEIMASMIGVPVGSYWQVANNFHVYDFNFGGVKNLYRSDPYDPYELGEVSPYPMVRHSGSRFITECEIFCEEGRAGVYTEPFFEDVAIPMFQAWICWKKRKEMDNWRRSAISHLVDCKASDWRRACIEWIERRAK